MFLFQFVTLKNEFNGFFSIIYNLFSLKKVNVKQHVKIKRRISCFLLKSTDWIQHIFLLTYSVPFTVKIWQSIETNKLNKTHRLSIVYYVILFVTVRLRPSLYIILSSLLFALLLSIFLIVWRMEWQF
jgi:hypothetical protein